MCLTNRDSSLLWTNLVSHSCGTNWYSHCLPVHMFVYGSQGRQDPVWLNDPGSTCRVPNDADAACRAPRVTPYSTVHSPLTHRDTHTHVKISFFFSVLRVFKIGLIMIPFLLASTLALLYLQMMIHVHALIQRQRRNSFLTALRATYFMRTRGSAE